MFKLQLLIPNLKKGKNEVNIAIFLDGLAGNTQGHRISEPSLDFLHSRNMALNQTVIASLNTTG